MQEEFEKKFETEEKNGQQSRTDFNVPAVSNSNSSVDDDCVEAEIVYEGGDSDKSRHFGNGGKYGRRDGTDGFSNNDGTTKAINRIKTMFQGLGGIMLVIGLVLATGGIFLSSTVIGIIFGIPMIIAGVFLIWLGISMIGGGKTVVFKNNRED